MLELRPTCEHCNKKLPPESKEAMICTLRMHVLQLLRYGCFEQRVPELRRRIRHAAQPAIAQLER